jgi:predicted ABC-type transport system involved in lysophospholipase L1 biosynthesis ATPase subunit
VSAGGRGGAVLRLRGGIDVVAGTTTWRLGPLELGAGEWVVLSPAAAPDGADPAPSLVRTLGTVAQPVAGTVEILGRDPASLPYLELQRLRARLGYVQATGGLLSNRTVRENIALPVLVHAGLAEDAQDELLDATLAHFELAAVAARRPHELDVAVQWRVKVARALVLAPALIVLEGAGAWAHDAGRGVGWSRLLAFRAEGRPAAAVCLGQPDAAFQGWFEGLGGRVVPYRAVPAVSGAGEERSAP